MRLNSLGPSTYAITVSAFVLFSLFSTFSNAQDDGPPTSSLPIPRSHLTNEERAQAVRIGAKGLLDSTPPLSFRSSSSDTEQSSGQGMTYGLSFYNPMRHSQEISGVVGTDNPQIWAPQLWSGKYSDVLSNVLSSVESVDDNNPNSRLAIVTIYNYQRDETIRRLVDLAQNKITKEKILGGSRAPLAHVERRVAESLVLTDPRIVALLGPDVRDVEVGTLLTTTQDPRDEFYRQRVVLTTLKTSRGYPQNLPKIFVNLTKAAVIIHDARNVE